MAGIVGHIRPECILPDVRWISIRCAKPPNFFWSAKGAVSNYVQRAVQQGLSWPLPADLDESALEGLLFRQAAPREEYAQPDFSYLHQELKRKSVTLQLLWEMGWTRPHLTAQR